MTLFGRGTNDLDWREKLIAVAAEFRAHVAECTRTRAEDLTSQAQRHAENTQRLDKQDEAIDQLTSEVKSVGAQLSRELFRSVATVLGVMVTLCGSLLWFVVTHQIK